MKLSGLKKAVGDYQRANAGGAYSMFYGFLMLNKATGELWTDEFCDLGHGTYMQYHSPDIINLSRKMAEQGLAVNMANVRALATQLCGFLPANNV